MKIKFEVRCCCDPSILLGWIFIEESFIIHQRLIQMPTTTLIPTTDKPLMDLSSSITVEFERFNDVPNNRSYKAVKSNDIPIERWERLPQFQRNPDYIGK